MVAERFRDPIGLADVACTRQIFLVGGTDQGSRRSIRSLLTAAVAAIGGLAILSVTVLLVTTAALERTTSGVVAAVESLRLAQDAEINLLLHHRATDAVVKQDYETELRVALVTAEQYVTTREERALLNATIEAVDRYLDLSVDPSASPASIASAEAGAFGSIDRFATLNVADARAARQQAIARSENARIVGSAAAVLIAVLALTVVVWLRRRFVRPWFALAETVRRFGQGERSVRAQESGPTELREIGQQFNAMADAIATQRQAQVAFLGGVAHDLRNPLSALKLATEMLHPTDPLPPEPQLRRTLAVVTRQIRHLERMVGDFVDMSQIEAGKLDLQVDYHDVRPIVSQAVGLFATTDAEREFNVALPRESALALCDDVRLAQVVTNLVSNAVKYSPANASIDVKVSTQAGDVVIEVVDHGPGIAREDQERIFEPFRRVGDKAKATGSGLGLYNVKRLVEAHGGTIALESVPGEGSVFTVKLRLAHVDTTESASRARAHPTLSS